MDAIEQAVDVECPIDVVYNQWTQFEEFPRFMSGITAVRQLDDTHVHWEAEILGKSQEWSAEIVEQKPDECISWRSTSGTPNRGTVSFMPLSPARTRVSLKMAFEPEGAAENLGTMLGVVDRQVQRSIEGFRNFIEARQHETGAWRGEISRSISTGPEI